MTITSLAEVSIGCQPRAEKKRVGNESIESGRTPMQSIMTRTSRWRLAVLLLEKGKFSLQRQRRARYLG
jgi:hypothetical protein